ncbi:MAG: type II toxin-antitoxin system HicA family toxin [Candidatus Yonathbacteria bacterium]|nr:type II toxin-antitoxin system HicA family toxin [Candidatus Yonathbacteria bacterium]
MPKLYSSRYIVSVLERVGFRLVSQRGSHGKFKISTGSVMHVVIVPLAKREIPYGTFRSIVRQAGLSEDDFIR